MTPPAPARIVSVAPGRPAARAGLEAGELLVSINGRTPRDYIEYRYLTAEASLDLMVERLTGRRETIRLEKAIDEDLGIRFEEDVFDGVRTCRNSCVFCFVDQLPPGARRSLWLKDDDYRLSFLHGNFVTLTNLRESDWQRILGQHLSPLYVSVHTTNDALRARLFGVKRLPPLRPQLERLAAGGIELHAQVVVCPGWNDGEELARTVRELGALGPGAASVGVVPVGLTRYHRRGLRTVTESEAERIVEAVESWQASFLRARGSRFVFAADELYLLARRPVPEAKAYEGYPQLANGIGGAREFLEEVKELTPAERRGRGRVTLVTGAAAAGLVAELASRLGGAEVVVVANEFLGPTVTSAGLLAGRDVARALGARRGELVILPASCLREGRVFLDDMTVEELAEVSGAEVKAAGGPREAAELVARR
jgi:putative radical SAM enzyme (TIGR03279 family)